jgi:hypothetical protein
VAHRILLYKFTKLLFKPKELNILSEGLAIFINTVRVRKEEGSDHLDLMYRDRIQNQGVKIILIIIRLTSSPLLVQHRTLNFNNK